LANLTGLQDLLGLIKTINMANEITPELTETRFKIANMVCEGCAEKITDSLKGMHGVKDVKAKVFQKQIHVYHYSEQVKQDELKKALETAGFNAIEL